MTCHHASHQGLVYLDLPKQPPLAAPTLQVWGDSHPLSHSVPSPLLWDHREDVEKLIWGLNGLSQEVRGPGLRAMLCPCGGTGAVPKQTYICLCLFYTQPRAESSCWVQERHCLLDPLHPLQNHMHRWGETMSSDAWGEIDQKPGGQMLRVSV